MTEIEAYRHQEEVHMRLERAEEAAKAKLVQCRSNRFYVQSNEAFYEKLSETLRKMPTADISTVKGLCDNFGAILILFKNYQLEPEFENYEDWEMKNFVSLVALKKEFGESLQEED